MNSSELEFQENNLVSFLHMTQHDYYSVTFQCSPSSDGYLFVLQTSLLAGGTRKHLINILKFHFM